MDIPQEIFDTYYSVCDDFIDSNFGVNCQLNYPEQRVDCENCVFNPLTNMSAGIYSSGGPIPFTNGDCPYCNGLGYRSNSQLEVIKMRCYFQKKDWVKLPAHLNLPDGKVQTIAHMRDLPKILRCVDVILNTQVLGYHNYTYKLAGEPIPHGFRNNKYVICMWK